MKTYHNGRVSVHSGDCREVLAQLPESHFDAVCVDPPYHLTSIVKRFGKSNLEPDPNTLAAPIGRQSENPYMRASRGFMGKVWDGGDIAFQPDTWAAVLRVMKPGAHLLAFSGTRTFHRMACAIEDAGFEIRDAIMWHYGAGFPKSHNLDNYRGKIFCGCEQTSERDLRSLRIDDVSPTVNSSDECREVLQQSLPQQSSSSPERAKSEEGPPWAEEHLMEGWRNLPQAARELCVGSLCEMPAGIHLNGSQGWLRDGASPCDGEVDQASIIEDGDGSPHRPFAVEQSPQQPGALAGQPKSQTSGTWPLCERCRQPIVPRGLGSALKPATEIICLARKPLSEPTIAANVLRWGCGAINIDGCRIATDESTVRPVNNIRVHGGRDGAYVGQVGNRPCDGRLGGSDKGRWPANLVHDGSEEVLRGFPEAGGGFGVRGESPNWGPASKGGGTMEQVGFGDSGSAARFFATFPQENPKQRAQPFSTERGWNSHSMTREGQSAPENYNDRGSASRYFYTAKADAQDRIGSKHPTVKPLDLLQWLTRLITPPRGHILDCFAGTGTTAEAALREGFRCTLIEREDEYLKDIDRRMSLVFEGETGRSVAMAKLKPEGEPLPLFAETAE